MDSSVERRISHLSSPDLYQIALGDTFESEHPELHDDERELMDFYWAQEDLESQSENAPDEAERKRAKTELANIREQYPDLYVRSEILKQEIAARAELHSKTIDGFDNGTI